jgi:outer membrane protein assembly factor BamD
VAQGELSGLKASIIAILLLALVWTGSTVLTGCGGGSASLANLSSEQLYTLAREKYDNEKYTQAIEAFQQLVYNFPGQSIVDTAQYYLAMSYFGNEAYELAAVEFNRLLINYPASAYATQAQLMRAVSTFESTPDHYGLDQSELPEAIDQLEDFIIDHPESELVQDANAYLLLARTRLAKKYYYAGVTYTRMGASQSGQGILSEGGRRFHRYRLCPTGELCAS